MVSDEMLFVELVEVIRAEVVVGGLVSEDVIRNDEDALGYGDNSLLPSSSFGESLVPRSKAASVRTRLKYGLPFRVFPLLCFPALSLFPGQIATHEARCFSLGKESMLTPISEMIVSATRTLIPRTSSSSSASLWKGAM